MFFPIHIGAAVGGGIAYLLDKGLQDDQNTTESYTDKIARNCINAVDEYLLKLSKQGLSILEEYERKAEKIIKFIPVNQDSVEIAAKRKELKQWHKTLNDFNKELEQVLGIYISPEFQVEIEEETTKNPPQSQSQSQSVYSYSGKGVKEDVGTFKKSPPKKEAPKKKCREKIY